MKNYLNHKIIASDPSEEQAKKDIEQKLGIKKFPLSNALFNEVFIFLQNKYKGSKGFGDLSRTYIEYFCRKLELDYVIRIRNLSRPFDIEKLKKNGIGNIDKDPDIQTLIDRLNEYNDPDQRNQRNSKKRQTIIFVENKYTMFTDKTLHTIRKLLHGEIQNIEKSTPINGRKLDQIENSFKYIRRVLNHIIQHSNLDMDNKKDYRAYLSSNKADIDAMKGKKYLRFEISILAKKEFIKNGKLIDFSPSSRNPFILNLIKLLAKGAKLKHEYIGLNDIIIQIESISSSKHSSNYDWGYSIEINEKNKIGYLKIYSNRLFKEALPVIHPDPKLNGEKMKKSIVKNNSVKKKQATNNASEYSNTPLGIIISAFEHVGRGIVKIIVGVIWPFYNWWKHND